MNRILVVGDIITDIVVVHSGPLAVDSDTAATVGIAGGGSAANTAAWLAFAGAPVALLGVVGTDPAGEERIRELVAAGVDCGSVVRRPGAVTGTVVVLTDGRRRTMLTDRGANHELNPADVDAALATAPDLAHVHLSGYTLLDARSRPAGLAALTAARERGLTASVDAASAAPLRRVGAQLFRDWVAGVDLLLANLDEAVALASTVDSEPAAVATALSTLAGEVVVKLGADGALWAGDGEVHPVPVHPATAVDTTGAGDAFAAGLLAARLAGAGRDAALDAAVRLAARAVATLGGRPPTV